MYICVDLENNRIFFQTELEVTEENSHKIKTSPINVGLFFMTTRHEKASCLSGTVGSLYLCQLGVFVRWSSLWSDCSPYCGP